MVYVMAIHDSDMSNEEYRVRLIKKYAFLLNDTFELHVHSMNEIEGLPSDGSSYHHVYFDDDSILRNDERVLKALIKFSNSRQIWITVKNTAKASTNPDKKGKKNRTFTSGVGNLIKE